MGHLARGTVAAAAAAAAAKYRKHELGRSETESGGGPLSCFSLRHWRAARQLMHLARPLLNDEKAPVSAEPLNTQNTPLANAPERNAAILAELGVRVVVDESSTAGHRVVVPYTTLFRNRQIEVKTVISDRHPLCTLAGTVMDIAGLTYTPDLGGPRLQQSQPPAQSAP